MRNINITNVCFVSSMSMVMCGPGGVGSMSIVIRRLSGIFQINTQRLHWQCAARAEIAIVSTLQPDWHRFCLIALICSLSNIYTVCSIKAIAFTGIHYWHLFSVIWRHEETYSGYRDVEKYCSSVQCVSRAECHWPLTTVITFHTKTWWKV